LRDFLEKENLGKGSATSIITCRSGGGHSFTVIFETRPDRTTGFRERSFETSSILFPMDGFLTALDRLPSCHRPRMFVAEVHEDERNRLLLYAAFRTIVSDHACL
jgi:hypothetical protein